LVSTYGIAAWAVTPSSSGNASNSPTVTQSTTPSLDTFHLTPDQLPDYSAYGLTTHIVHVSDLSSQDRSQYAGHQANDIVGVTWMGTAGGATVEVGHLTKNTTTIVNGDGYQAASQGMIIAMDAMYIARILEDTRKHDPAGTLTVTDPASHQGNVTITMTTLPTLGVKAVTYSRDTSDANSGGDGYDGVLFNFNTSAKIVKGDTFGPNGETTPMSAYANHGFFAPKGSAYDDQYGEVVWATTPDPPLFPYRNCPEGTKMDIVNTQKAVWVSTSVNHGAAIVRPLMTQISGMTYFLIPIA
jgi:hypothetical protein